MPERQITLIVPYYRNPAMLAEQVKNWNHFPDPFTLIVVDDGSPEHAQDVILQNATVGTLEHLQLYRIGIDIPWNRGGARNLGTHVATTDWIIHIDIDHLMLPSSAARLLRTDIDRAHWYRFERFRRGRADATRRKDKIPNDQTFGAIHPHVDSYLCTRDRYWQVGGYDEDYSGCLGGGNPFLHHMDRVSKPLMLPPEVNLHVYTRDVVADASDTTLSRDSAEYTRRKRLKQESGNTKPINPLRFPWERVL